MKYRAYDTFIDYLFSADAKEHPYDDLKAYLTTSGDYSSFNPRETTFFPMSSLSGAFVPSSKFTYPAARMDARPEVSNSNGLYNETDKSYEEVFNIPLKTNIATKAAGIIRLSSETEQYAISQVFLRPGIAESGTAESAA